MYSGFHTLDRPRGERCEGQASNACLLGVPRAGVRGAVILGRYILESFNFDVIPCFCLPPFAVQNVEYFG